MQDAAPVVPSSRSFWSRVVVIVLGAIALAALVDPVVTIGDPISRNYNEGWNALHVQRLLDGQGLYPPEDALFVNNYPPLSFVVVAAVSGVVGDPLVAGRVVSLLSMFVVAGALFAIVRTIAACRGIGVLAGGLFLFLLSIHFRQYAVMNDPQMLGHAFQWIALALWVRGRDAGRGLWVVVALLVAGGLVKHNLVNLPIALVTIVALFRRDRLGALILRFGVLVAAGCAWLVVGWGGDVFASVLGHARAYETWRVKIALTHWLGPVFWWFVVAAAEAIRGGSDPRRWLLRLVAIVGVATGIAFSMGGGISYNVVFDGVIALCGLTALGVQSLVPAPVHTVRRDLERATAVAFLVLFSIVVSPFGWPRMFVDSDARRVRLATFERDLAFVQGRPGPIMAGTLTLVHAAGRSYEVDLFNVHQAILAGVMDEGRLADRIRARDFAVIQLSAYDRNHRMTPGLMQAVEADYVLARESDVHGRLYVPRDLSPSLEDPSTP